MPTLESAYEKENGLQQIWDATDPKPFPAVFDDFRRSIMDDFYDRLASSSSRANSSALMQ
jgi:hypothetical protein